MAFGKKKEDQSRSPAEDSVIGDYPGFTPPRYFRPTTPVVEQEDDPSQVPNNVWRGTESHGLLMDSHVHPQNAETEQHEYDESAVAEIYPEFEDDCPVPVRVVEDQGRHRNDLAIETFTVTGSTPVRILGQDPMRTQARILVLAVPAQVGTGVPVLLANQNSLATYGFPIPTGGTGLLLRTDQDLWVAATDATTTFTVAVLSERRLIIDLPDSATRK